MRSSGDFVYAISRLTGEYGKQQGKKFFDVTDHVDDVAFMPINKLAQAAISYPTTMAQNASVAKLFPLLSKDKMNSTLTEFSNFHNR
jgi:hypothetical protein